MALLVAGAALATAVCAWGMQRHPDRTRATVRVLLWSWVVLVAVVTVAPDQPPGTYQEPVNWRLGASFRASGIGHSEDGLLVSQYIGNAAMFFPVGVLGWFSSRRGWWTLVWSAALSASIEALQQVMAAGRTADIDDLFCNSFGAATGIAVATFSYFIVMFRRSRGAAAEGDRKAVGRRAGTG
ncbi:VanZ family protein [Streptomyces sp. B1866]|nr:VanZ family protein [Streptomyces sp. B1866]